MTIEAGRPGRLETNHDGAAGAGGGRGPHDRDGPAPARAATKQAPVLAQGAGMSGKPSAAVRHVQRVLRSRGYSLGRPGVDGRFGPLTAAAVRLLQSDRGLRRRRHRRPADPQGRRSHRAPRTADPPVDAHDRQQLAHQSSRRPKAAAHAAERPRPRRWSRTHGDGAGSSRRLAAALAAFCVGLALAPATPRPQPASQPPAICRWRTSSTSRAAATRRASGGSAGARWPRRSPRARRRPLPGRTWYLVDDARKPAPVWVRQDDMRRLPSGLSPGERSSATPRSTTNADAHEGRRAVHARSRRRVSAATGTSPRS